MPDSLPQPRRRLWRTWLKWPRNLRAFAPRVATEEVLAHLPDMDDVAHWGEVTLLEDIVVALHQDGTSSWLTHVIMSPFGDENLAAWDEVARGFDERKTRLTVRKGLVFLPDGSQRKVKKVVVPMNAHERALKLTFAPLRPGVIVELELQEDQFAPDEIGPAIWANFSLQTMFPCRRRRFTVAVAEPFNARIELHHHSLAPSESHFDGYRVYRWEQQDITGIEVDAWTPPPPDFAPWIDISTLPNWAPIANHYHKELLPDAAALLAVKGLAAELTANAKTEREKAFAVFRYAAQNLRYGRHPSELEAPKIREASKMLEDLRGDCKDKSSLMVSLFKHLNIPARIAVLLTAQNGRTPMLPSRRFDHAIVVAKVDGQDVWFDPAAGPFTFGHIPLNDQGVQALVLDGGAPDLMKVPQDEPARQGVNRQCVGELTADGDYRYVAKITAGGERAAQYRFTLQDRNEYHRRRTVQQSVAEERPGAEVTEVILGDIEDLNTDVHYGYTVRLPQWARRIQDLLLFRIPWAEMADVTGPISAVERRHPLQIPSVLGITERHEITIPTSFAGYGLPYEATHACAGVEYSLRIECHDGRLKCERRMALRSGIVPVEQFAEFKVFWEKCSRADRMDVVLMKQGH